MAHQDGDDYTWGNDSQPAAVLKPTAAFAELRAQFGAEFDRAFPAGWEGLAAADQTGAEPGTAEAWAERWQRQAQRAMQKGRYSLEDTIYEMDAAKPGPDLRTADQVERDDVAALRSDLDRLAELVRLTMGPLDVALDVSMLRDTMGDFDRRLTTLEATVTALVKVLEVRL